ncbi:MAG: hypothetical protein HYV06_08740 [Deltaproteobacteria bacterium]|nr:hypothetical protein [Deltaproteobacteria bacterium]
MTKAAQIEKNDFGEVLRALTTLSISQQRFIHEMLAGARTARRSVSSKSKLRKSFGIWADRKDIGEGIEYVNELRKGWNSRAERIAVSPLNHQTM